MPIRDGGDHLDHPDHHRSGWSGVKKSVHVQLTTFRYSSGLLLLEPFAATRITNLP